MSGSDEHLITFGPTLAASLLALATILHPPHGAVQTLGYAAVGLAAYAVVHVMVAADPLDRAALRRLIARRSHPA